MIPEPEKNEKKPSPPDRGSFRVALKSVPARFWRVLSHNLPWKLLAVFLAVCFWAGLITQDPTLTRERVFSDVAVSVMGADTLLRNSSLVILNDFEAEPFTIRLRADVPQREYNTVSASNYNPRIDLSKITQAGKQTLKILTTSSTTYGTVQELTPDSIEVEVDDYIPSYRVPVSIQMSGQYPKGFYGTTPSLAPSSVTVSGPKSIVDQVARVIVDYDVSSLKAQAGSVSTAVPIHFVDLDGNPIDSKRIDVTSAGVLLRSVVVEQTLYPTKTLPISSLALTTGVPASGYEVKSVTATPNIIVAAGDEVGLSALDSLFLEKAVDVSGKNETFNAEIDIRQPSEIVYLSSKTVTLSIEIGPIISARKFDGLPLVFRDNVEKRAISSELKTVSVTLTGPSMLLDGIKSSALTLYVDVGQLVDGEYELPILLDIEGIDGKKFTYDISPKLVQLRIETP